MTYGFLRELSQGVRDSNLRFPNLYLVFGSFTKANLKLREKKWACAWAQFCCLGRAAYLQEVDPEVLLPKTLNAFFFMALVQTKQSLEHGLALTLSRQVL